MDNDKINGKEEIVINQFLYRIKNLRSDKAKEHALNFQPPKNSYFILTFPKSGTTLTQQICHQLRSRGDMDFEEISFVSPYFDTSYDHNIDIYQKQKYDPPIFKTHQTYFSCPKDAKYIFVVRNPYDVASSFYHYLGTWLFDKKELSIDTFAKKAFLGMKPDAEKQDWSTYFGKIIECYQNRHNVNVLWLHYEDFIANLRACVILLAEFMGMDTTDTELIDIAENKEFMLLHKKKYDSAPFKIGANLVLGLDKYKGVDGEAKVCEYDPLREKISASGRKAIDKHWLEVVAPEIGFKSYDEMRSAINKEFNGKF